MFAYHLIRSGCPNKTDLICDFQTYLLSTYTQACKKYEDFEVFVAANKKKTYCTDCIDWFNFRTSTLTYLLPISNPMKSSTSFWLVGYKSGP